MKPIAKTKRAEAERAAEWWLREECGCVLTRRAVKTQFNKVDFFASDVVGKREDGSHVYAQATAGQAQAVTQRRRKLEVIPWHVTDDVYLLQLRGTPNPANRRRTMWHFCVHYYGHVIVGEPRCWMTFETAYPVPEEWFRAWKQEEIDA